MAARKGSRRGHTGKTDGGNTRGLKIDRIGRVTIYRRGDSYTLYYREGGKPVRRKIDGNLAVAKTTASQVEASLAKGGEVTDRLRADVAGQTGGSIL